MEGGNVKTLELNQMIVIEFSTVIVVHPHMRSYRSIKPVQTLKSEKRIDRAGYIDTDVAIRFRFASSDFSLIQLLMEFLTIKNLLIKFLTIQNAITTYIILCNNNVRITWINTIKCLHILKL